MPKTITKIDASPRLKQKTKAAAYARVSSGKDAMLQSLSAQVSYYSRMIQNNADWEFVGVYADEAVSGTKDSRDDFQRLMSDCKAGKINLVITKSISRFARNVVTLLSAVRELKSSGVDVYFEEQNIHTISSEGEFILTCLASMAQEEAKSTSENMKWRIKQDFKDGLSWGYRHCLGYSVKDRKYVIIPEEAEIVRYVYKLYLDGCGFYTITKILNEEGYVTIHGKPFVRSEIKAILSNISYTGNMILQKTYRTDYLTKHKKINKGERDMYYCENSHEAIIPMDIFLKVQEITKERAEKAAKNKRIDYDNPLQGIVKCGICGKNYRRKVTPYKVVWKCATYVDRGKNICPAKQVTQDQLEKAICEALGLRKYSDKELRKVKSIVVRPHNMLEITLANGKIFTTNYVYESISKSWTPEKRELARQKAINRNRKLGGDDTNGKSNDNPINS